MWDDLSNPELFSRLVQRGVSHDEARELVNWRDREEFASRIEEILGNDA